MENRDALLNKTIGAILIVISLGAVAVLVPGLVDLKNELVEFIDKYKPGFPTGDFTVSSFKQIIGWIMVYFIFRMGRSFYKEGQKPTSTSK